MASAQVQQTIEGAQSFLSQVSAAGDWTMVPCEDGVCRWYITDWWLQDFEWGGRGSRYNQVPHYDKKLQPEWTITSFSGPTRCSGRFQFRRMQLASDGQERGVEVKQSDLYGHSFDWWTVSQIRAAAGFVYLEMRSVEALHRVTYRVNVNSAELATRVAFAMDFLRANCDHTSDTGF